MTKAKIGDIQINYEIYGEGPPLIMILGLGQDIATWGLQIPELSKHFKLILFDNRDSGESSRCTEDYSTEDMARDTIGLIDYLEVDSVNLLGTSMGGMIAQHIALTAPERVNSLILASSSPKGAD